ncbi:MULTISPECIES: Crp/Fnr family transcriptional regulator [unclassified Beijerinckia]|uniref:Crp/Fnr family transcriptional regulator n=1 Tax=unclassified Beijerinckia TaxID=2638183 RepID=UPI00089B169A|nr:MULTISPECIES: Crp/Fnr family transcriptional regulator [unclassified Beijerinckia]MDH7794737.1 CRP/FNR family cyclic AMP-dependent transcriptional regulator [Beijerinckia sp. GAS462]SEB73218.1 cAMP-binding domain of CRP or a regulatory subunit of cAMP-dependent protein kinases [Beijerinckia sp. 28-YEA-48]
MQTLARIPFFKDTSDIDLTLFDRRCTWKRYDQNEIVVDFEDRSSDVYFILSGDVRVLIRTAAGKEVILAEMKAGQFFGEMSAIDSVARSANVTALTRSELCIMPAAVFRELLFGSRSICEKVMRLLTGRIRESNARLTEYSIFDLKHRLYAELLRISAPRTGHDGQRIVSPPPFHHVLAARIGCRREQITRELSALDHETLVEKSRGGLVLLKPKVLEARLAEAMRNEG